MIECEFVDVEAIHAEALREHLLTNPALFENREDFQTMREFLDLHKTDKPIVGNFYVYASVQTTPISRYLNVAHFDNEHKLLKLINNIAYFDINGVEKRFPETSAVAGDLMSEIYFFNNINKFNQIELLLRTKFSDYKITHKILDEQVNEGLSTIKPIKFLAGVTK
jgi:hypothetical protein